MSPNLKLPSALRADCSRCAALCCVTPGFYKVQGFGFDKPAHTACAHLQPNSKCAIHRDRAAHGFVACIGFDCYGAGQRVTREVCRDSTWIVSRENRARVSAVYASYLVLHRLMATLTIAEQVFARDVRAALRLKRMQLNRLCRSDDARRGRLDLSRLSRETHDLVRSCATTPRDNKPTPQ